MSYSKFYDNKLKNNNKNNEINKQMDEVLTKETNIEYNSEKECEINDNSIIEKENLDQIQPYIGKIDDISEHDHHHIDNEFILNGYRINFHSIKHILKSLFLLHNETFNVWSHLSGCLVVIFLMIFTFCTISSYSLLTYNIMSSILKNVNIEKMSIKELEEYRSKFINKTSVISYNKNITEIEIRTNLNFLSIILEGKRYIQKFNNSNSYQLKYEFQNIYKFYKKELLCVSCFENIVNLNITEFEISKISNDFIIEMGLERKILLSKNKNTIDFSEYNLSNVKNEPTFIGLNKNYLVTWPLLMIFIGGIVCLGFSSSFHLFSAHSCTVKKVFNRMDYAGIAILIMGSCYPPYYYYFYCNSCKL